MIGLDLHQLRLTCGVRVVPNAAEGNGRYRATNLGLGFSTEDYHGRRMRAFQLEMSR
jgi:hypothetical protein